jgi:signal transduction histidine kinase/CheY-like chemotaxis protein
MSGPLTRFGIDSESREQRQEKILAGVIASVYRQVPQSVLGSIVLSFALVAAFWNTHNQNVLMAWFIAMLVESLVRLRVARSFAKSNQAVERVHTWASWWVALAASAGVLWGAAGVVFFSPQEPSHQLVLVAVILGVAFGSLTLYATHRPALFFFLPLALLPLVGRMIAEQDPAYYSAAIVMLAVFGFASFFGRNFGEAMFESEKNNYENEVLVGQLLTEKRVADDARRDAENATRSKTQFFAAASHDLRQPLQAIGIYVTLLKKRVQGPAEPLVANLSSAVESLSKLVEELLEISRLDSGAIQPRIQQVLLDDMFKALEQEFTPMAASKGLALRVRRCGAAIDSDPLLLLRVMRNLLANAIKYTREGGVLLAARPRGGVMSIEVWDTGAGIKQQELDRVFEEFYRGESGKVEGGGGGFGLGLSIVKRICGVLGHPLIVTTRPGSGTVFRVEAQLSSQPRRRARAPEPVETVLRALTGYTVVVLEDNEEILNSMTRLLRSWGADIISSTSFNASLVKKLSLRPKVDLILADQNLGNSTISGVEAAFRIRELVGFPVPVVMLTAVQQLEVLAEFQRVMRDRLAKNPDQAAAIARSRVEEPIVLQKPSTTVVVNRTLADALGIPPPEASRPRVPTEPVAEGTEERVR